MTKLGEISNTLSVPTPFQLGLWPRALSLQPQHPYSLFNFANKNYINFPNMVFNETNKKYDHSLSTYQNLFYEAQDQTVLYHN